MIGRLRGLLAEQSEDRVVLEVAGVGYVVAVTPRTLSGLPGIGEEVVLHTHLHVREDQLALYGFDTAEDKDLFGMLLGVSGVGPKVRNSCGSPWCLMTRRRSPRCQASASAVRRNSWSSCVQGWRSSPNEAQQAVPLLKYATHWKASATHPKRYEVPSPRCHTTYLSKTC